MLKPERLKNFVLVTSHANNTRYPANRKYSKLINLNRKIEIIDETNDRMNNTKNTNLFSVIYPGLAIFAAWKSQQKPLSN